MRAVELRNYLRILREKWWLVAIAFVSTLAATVIFTTMQTPIYSATATYIVAPAAGYDTVEDLANALDAMSRRAEIAGTYVNIATSRQIRHQAADELGLSAAALDALSVNSVLVAGTNVIEITVEGPDRYLVRDFADAVGASTASYVQDLYEAYGLTSLDTAQLPRSPVKPQKMVNTLLGAALGLALGVGLAFLFTYLDTTLRTTQQIEAALRVPSSAQIPVDRKRSAGSAYSLSRDPEQVEACLRLRTTVLSHGRDKPTQALLVTSAGQGEGKTTIVAHLAAAIAHAERKVIVIDADLRQPTLHKYFNIGNQEGLRDVLEGQAPLDRALRPTSVPGLSVLPSGHPLPARAVDLLSSARMRDLLDELRAACDLVLIDTPAWLAVTDGIALAPMVDGALLVASCARVTSRDLQTVSQQLANTTVRIVGVVVNRAHTDGKAYYGYRTTQVRTDGVDPLTDIPGIDFAYEAILNQLGILTFEQLAAQDPGELADRLVPYTAGRAQRVVCENWVAQAQTLVQREQNTGQRPAVLIGTGPTASKLESLPLRLRIRRILGIARYGD